MKFLKVILIAVTILFCTDASAQKLKVVASFSILADVIQNIGGDLVEVTAIVGPNADTHVYKPTPHDSKEILGADIVVVSGLGFEGWITNLIDASGYRGSIVMAAKSIKPLMMGGDLKSATAKAPDPHVWNDVENVVLWAAEISLALQKRLPEKRKDIQAQEKKYIERLRNLDKWIRASFKDVPSKGRKIITAHDAFSYFGRAYGITFLAPSGLSTEDEPSAFEVAHLIRQIKQEKIHTIFVENIAGQQLIQQIAAETGAKIGGVLYSDALSEPGTSGDTYLKMMRHNVSLFVSAFSQ